MAALALAAGAVRWLDLARFAGGRISWEPAMHEPGAPWSWQPLLHPPLRSEYLRFLGWLAERWDAPVDHGILVGAAVLAPLTALVAMALARLAGRSVPLAGALFLVAPSQLRAVDTYPIAALANTGACLAVLAAWRVGSRRSAWVAGVAVLAASQVHLSCWFLLGPLLVALGFVRHPRWAAQVAGGSLLAFAFTASPLLYRNSAWQALLAIPNDQEPWLLPPNLLYPDLEWSNPVLVLALGLWVLPRVRGSLSWGGPLALATAVFIAIHVALRAAGVALGDSYLVLVEGLLITLALAAASSLAPRQGRRLLVLVVLSQVLTAGLYERTRMDTAWLARENALAPERVGAVPDWSAPAPVPDDATYILTGLTGWGLELAGQRFEQDGPLRVRGWARSNEARFDLRYELFEGQQGLDEGTLSCRKAAANRGATLICGDHRRRARRSHYAIEGAGVQEWTLRSLRPRSAYLAPAWIRLEARPPTP